MEQYILISKVPTALEWFQQKKLHARCDSDIGFVADQHRRQPASEIKRGRNARKGSFKRSLKNLSFLLKWARIRTRHN